MGYFLNAAIARRGDLAEIERCFKLAKVVPLTAEIDMIPMTEEFHQVNSDHAPVIERFEYFNSVIESRMLEVMGDKMFAYIEACYFGGSGGQSGIIWKSGLRVYEHHADQDVINAILKQFGVIRKRPLDEFDTVCLGKHRDTEDWLAES